jgi:hypothetical protein
MNHTMRSAGLRRRASPATVRTVAAIFAAACLGLLAAACGGPGASSSRVATLPSPSAAVSATTQAGATGVPTASDVIARAVAYAGCMRANGVPDWPDPDVSGVFDKNRLEHLGVTDAQLQAGEAACAHLLPNGGGGPTQQQLQQGTAQALAFARCMRSHGVPGLPDPDLTGRIPDPASVGLDQGAPLFRAANDACGSDRPGYFPSNAEYDAWAGTHTSGGSGASASGSGASANPTSQP